MNIDATDRAILYLLQQGNCRQTSTTEIADRVGISSSTVSNRLARLKEEDVLLDYHPQIDYEEAGIPHHILFVCTAPIVDRDEIAEEVIDIADVVNVCELLAGTGNLLVEAVCSDSSGIERVAADLDALAVDIEQSGLVRKEHHEPLAHFGAPLREG